MPFDTLTMAAMATELSFLAGGRIQRIIQPSATSVALAIYAGGEQGWLVLSADARTARVGLATYKLAKAFAEPSPFVMLLRKHLEDTRLERLTQVPGERILLLDAGNDTHLVAEVMGKHSNVILVHETRVLGALKIVPPHLSRVRPILPGRPYVPPPVQRCDERIFPAGARIDPYAHAGELSHLLAMVPSGTSASQALLGALLGASPFLAAQIVLSAGQAPNAEVAPDNISDLVSAASTKYSLFSSHAWQPYTFTDSKGRRDFAPYMPQGVEDVKPWDSLSAAIEHCLGGDESRDAQAAMRGTVMAEIDRTRRSAKRRLASLQRGLSAAAGADRVMEEGQLILAYGHLAVPRANELHIPDLELSIQLDPRRTVSENAERAFKRYHKLRDAAKRVPALLQQTERELARLDDLAAFAGMARTEIELRSLQRDVNPPTGEPSKAKKGSQKPRGPLRLVLEGYMVLVGRNARENEEVTFRLAARDDLWLHARERTGAHVILRGGEHNAPEEIVLAAASLAAYFSEGRSDTAVDVDVARPRDVRKIPGGALGRVTYRNFRTVRVEPGEGTWQPGGR